MSKILIGLNSKLGGGKDSFADYAVENFGYKKLFFASALKNEVKEFFIKYNIPFEDRNIWGTQSDKEEELIIENMDNICKQFMCFTDFKHKVPAGKTTYRYFLQWWGTDYRRVCCDQNYWTKKFIEEANKYDKVVCSDLRFPNELDTIVNNGGVCIKIIRPNSFQSNTALHISETALDHIDNWYTVIDNNSTLEDYYKKIHSVLSEIEEKLDNKTLLENWRI